MKIYFNSIGKPPRKCVANEYELKIVECEDGKRYCYPETPNTLQVWGEVRDCTRSMPDASFCVANGNVCFENYVLFPVEIVLFD